jgi:hypothetical protein
MNAFTFGRTVFRKLAVANQLDNNRAAGQLQPGQRYVGGQLVSGPGARPLSAAQQEEVNAYNELSTGFNALNASAGGAGRGGMAPVPQPAPRPAVRPPVAPAPRPALAPRPAARPTLPPPARKLPNLGTINTRTESPDLGGFE